MRSLIFVIAFLLAGTLNAQNELRVGIIKYKSEEKVLETFTPLFNYVAEKLDKELRLEIVEDGDLGYHLSNDVYDIGLFTVFPYLKAKGDFPELHVFATHTVNNSDYYDGSILVNRSSEIKELHELKGKRFLFVKPTSTSGYKYPKGILTENDMDIEHGYFDSYDFTYNHSASLDSLLNNKTDGIAIDRKYFLENPDKGKLLELSTYKVPYHAYVLAPGISPELEEKIKNILFNAHKDPSAKAIFQNPLNVTSVIPEDDNYYNLIRRYLRITRVKPALKLELDPRGQAEEVLNKNSDLLQLMKSKIELGVYSSHRFSEEPYKNQKYFEKITCSLFQVGDQLYHYQILLNDRLIDQGEDVPQSSLIGYLPKKIKDDALRNLPIDAHLYFNGIDWFLSYGKEDGINLEDYEFHFYPETSRTFILKGEDVSKLTALNTHFESDERFKKNANVKIIYSPEKEITIEDEDPTELNTYNIFSSSFWKSNYWDKLGLIFGVAFALVSALIGRYLTKRKKERFKDLLYETNELIKELVQGQYEMETRIIEQREKIGTLLDNGSINENQFLILKNRISDVQNILDGMKPKEIDLTPEQKEEFEKIVEDGKITEKEFLKILNILKKNS